MARSAKKSGAGFGSTVSSAIVICLAVAVAALGRIRLKTEENRMYGEINRLDGQLQELRRSNRKLQVDYEFLTSPAGLSARIKEMQLDLVMPGNDARVVLPEPGGEPPLPHAYAGPASGEGAILAMGHVPTTPGVRRR